MQQYKSNLNYHWLSNTVRRRKGTDWLQRICVCVWAFYKTGYLLVPWTETMQPQWLAVISPTMGLSIGGVCVCVCTISQFCRPLGVSKRAALSNQWFTTPSNLVWPFFHVKILHPLTLFKYILQYLNSMFADLSPHYLSTVPALEKGLTRSTCWAQAEMDQFTLLQLSLQPFRLGSNWT